MLSNAWRELQVNKIYTITNAQYIQTQYGKARIITLNNNNGQQVCILNALFRVL